MRRTNHVISVPLIILASQLMQPASFAQAAAMSPIEATQLLSKANALNVKCKMLAEDQSQGLKDLLARAEISLAEKASVAAARKAIAVGRSEGKAGFCDDVARKLVNDVYEAASTAVMAPTEQVASAEPLAPAAAAKPEEQQQPHQALAVADEPKQQKVVRAKPTKTKMKVDTASKPSKAKKGLGGYAVVAEEYYKALKCGANPSKLKRIYMTVLAEHQSAMTANRARDVRAMLQAAEARAGAKACG